MASEAARITFTSCDLFSILFSNGNVGSWRIVDSPLALSDTGMPPPKLMEFQEMKYSRRFQSEKLFFLIAGISCRRQRFSDCIAKERNMYSNQKRYKR